MFNRETVVRTFNGKEVKQEMVFGIGRLTNNPPAVQLVGKDEKKVLRGSKGHPFAIASDRKKDETEFFNTSAWGVTAENLERLGYKGQPIYFVGRIEKDEHQGKVYENLVLEKFNVLKYKDSDSKPANKNADTHSTASSTASSNEAPATGMTEVNTDAQDDDIPF